MNCSHQTYSPTNPRTTRVPLPGSALVRLLVISFILTEGMVGAVPAVGQSETTTTTPPIDAPATELLQLMDDIWDFKLSESPMLASDVGDPRGQDRLADVSLPAVRRRTEQTHQFLNRLSQIDAARLGPSARIDHALIDLQLRQTISDTDFQTHLMPITNREGFHISFPELANSMGLKTESDIQNYIARLRDFSRYTDQHITLLRQGIAAGLTQPAIIMRGSASQARAHVVESGQQSLLYRNIPDEVRESLGTATWQRLGPQVIRAIETSVIPAYRRLADFLEDEYVPACRGSIAIAATPRGREFYRACVRKFTTIDVTPEELFETGVRENARIRAEMEAIRAAVGFDGDLPAFLEHLRTDPKFYPKTADELLKEVALILKRADGRLPELFGRLPRIPYGIKEIPAYVAPQTSSAYYWPPATDGTRGGFYYINTYDLKSRPLYQLESLSMHEAVPGHHLQLALQAELTDLHPIRRQSGFTAFIEGWALYSERLAKEIGFYKDPYQEFGRLSMEAWRASRLVVDPGIHHLGWTRAQAIKYMRENTALSEHNIVAEIDRYIGWPGQALAYKSGELAITKMRRTAERRLGDRFDVRAFHDRVLEAGSIPIPLLQQRVDDWIQSVGQSN